MLLKTGVGIEQLHDQEMYEMVEKGMRDGMCQVSHKLAVANNKNMQEAYDENKPSNYISYLDANNLYGLAMSQKLPLKISSGQRKRLPLKSGMKGMSLKLIWGILKHCTTTTPTIH